ncbi:phosphoribosyltransferase family protein [Mesoaciditoga sp.]
MIDIEEILQSTQAIVHGHFKLESGFHTDTRIQLVKALQYTWYAKQIGEEMALKLHRFAPDCIVSPMTNGIIVGYEVARRLDIPFIFVERDDNFSMSFGHGLNPAIFRNLVIVEGVLESGQSVKEVIKALRRYDSEAMAIATVIKEIEKDKLEGLPIISLTKITPNLYAPDECPMCKNGVPLQS